jgi:hypothetical protein
VRGRNRTRAIGVISLAALAVVAIGVAAGRSGDGSSQAAAPRPPACAGATKTIERPQAVPENLLPPGTAITSRMNLPQDQTLVTGVIPLDFRAAVDFYVSGLPRKGYQLGAGDAEMTEAEALFLGERIRGKWKVNGIPDCESAATLTLLVSG